VGDAKRIRIEPITREDAVGIIKRYHYSGRVVQNSQLHLGVFLDGACLGAMQFGPSLDRRKTQMLVRDTKWQEFLELNRMAFADTLPRNSESRSLAIAMRMLKKHAPQVKWVITFADATQCGDGTIYRAAGFVLTDIKKSFNLARLPSGAVVHKMTLESSPTMKRPEFGDRTYSEITKGRYDFRGFCAAVGATILPGFQLRYVYFIDPAYRARLNVPEVPYARIAELGAAMYRGERHHATAVVDGPSVPPTADVQPDPVAPVPPAKSRKSRGKPR
jgi:hypothetical protein